MATWTTITTPAVGDPTKKQSFAERVVNNLVYLFNAFLSLVGSRETVINGSFESDADADGYPDGWTLTLYTGGTFSHETSTAAADGKAQHGKRSIKFTSPGGVGNGGGFVTSTDFFEIAENRAYFLAWWHKSSVAGIHNLVQIQFYDSTQTSISTTTLYDSAANPTSWRLEHARFAPPTNARYAKIILTGAKNDNTTAGSCWFDHVQLGAQPFNYEVQFIRAGAFKWTAPTNVSVIEAYVIGGGGGGGGEQGNGGGGGGAGGVARVIVAVTPGSTYDLVVGAAGTAGLGATPSDGGNGGNSTLTIGATTYTGAGGTGGLRSTGGGTGGAGGAGTNGDTNTTGGTGGTRSGTTGGDGGKIAIFGGYALGGTNVTGTGADGPHFGAGGAGAGDAAGNNNGGAGAVGAVILRW